MSVSKTTTKLGLPLPQPGDKPDWYDFGAASQRLDDIAGAANGIATLDTSGKVAQMPAGAVPQTRTFAGLDLSKDRTLAELIAAGLAAGTNGQANDSAKLGGVDAANFPQMSSGTWTPTLKGITAAGTPTYTVQAGSWHKVGKWCLINFTVGISTKGGMSGILRIDGLPFVPSENSAIIIGFPLGALLPDPFYTFGGYVMALSTMIQPVRYARTGTDNVGDTDITDNFSLNSCSCLYEVQ